MTDDIPVLFFAQSEHKSGRYGKIDMNYILNLSYSIPLVNEFFMYLGTYHSEVEWDFWFVNFLW